MSNLYKLSKCLVVLSLASGACSAQQVVQQQPGTNVEITVQDLGSGVYLLANGGPISVAAIADDGVILADAKLASVTDKVRAAIGNLTQQPIRYVISSHNHTANNGGNESLAKGGAIVVGSEMTRKRMAEGSRMEKTTIQPFAVGALPVVTFTDQFAVHLQGQTVTAKYVSNAHTDSDVVISFKEANVIFASDLCRDGEYPLIGTTENGSVGGMINAIGTIINLSNDQTKIVCAYGPIKSSKDMVALKDMLSAMQQRIAKLKKQGKSEDQAVAANPLKPEYLLTTQDAARAESFVRNVYRSVK
ncbi:MAG: MBL fold metallo-hydrolase [Steroidobacteraceae bacterium]